MFKNPNKECECDALELLTTMVKSVVAWMDSDGQLDRPFPKLAERINNHLHQQIDKIGRDKLPPEIVKVVESIDQGLYDADAGKVSHVHAVEVARDNIHQVPILREIFLCGKLKETRLGKEVFKAMHIFSEGDAKDATKALEVLAENRSCFKHHGVKPYPESSKYLDFR